MSTGEIVSPRRIRIAYCLDSFAIGGTELNAVRTAEALDPERFDLRVYHLQTHGPLRSRYERLGVSITHVPIPNLCSVRTAAQGMHLAKLLRRDDVDVVHSHDIYCNIFAVPWARILTNCPVIASRRWGHEASRRRLGAVNRWCSVFAHRVLVNSNAVANIMVGEEGMSRKKIVEIPNFLTDDAFGWADEATRTSQHRAWGIPQGAFVLGIVARLSPVKNHDLLLRAMERLDARFHLVVVGDGPLRDALAERGRQLGIDSRIHFLGEVISHRNLHESFDASVLCSFSEGFPNSVIEAMAAGRPVIATPVGGVTDAVTHGVTGLLVPVDDPAQLADAARQLEADPALRARLGKAGHEMVRMKFHQKAVIARLSALYETLAPRRLGASSGHVDG